LYQDGSLQKILIDLKNVTYQKDGATFLKTSLDGDEQDRALVKSDGKTYTYLLPDIAYHVNKFTRTNGKCIDIWGADHFSHIRRIKFALKSLGFNHENLTIISIQMVKLMKNGQEVNFSKRKGVMVTLDDLIESIGVDAAR
jgi:arginyl-tRNA synthetase